MKTRNKVISALAALFGTTLVFAACEETPTPEEQTEHTVSITVKYDNVTIKDTDVEGYDYTYMFSIISDGSVVSVNADYIDSSAVQAAAGTYSVVCSYGGESATANVKVNATAYTLDLAQPEITLITTQVASYNFKAHFTLKKDGVAQTLEDGMVTSNVTATAGDYTYSVTYAGITKTLTVHVLDDVIVVPSYSLKTLEVSKVESYDYTDLFSLYVEGKAVKVTAAMLDTSAISSAAVGDTVTVGFSYTKDGTPHTSSVRVKVVADLEYTVSARNIVIYPHSENVELESLFEIKRGDEIIPVTNDMISGAVNYSAAGEYVITLDAFGEQAEATVTVESGVIAKPAGGSDTVYIRKGTDKATYAFSSDFNIVINGMPFFAIPDEFFEGLDGVDFNTVGEYTVTLKVPYNTNTIGFSGVPGFKYTECEITYSVRERIGSARAIAPVVDLKRGVNAYDVFDNVYAVLNGRKTDLTDNPDWVSVLAVYADVKSAPLDMTSNDVQHVVIDVYVNGTDADPVTVEYDVSIRDDVTITVNKKSVFTGETLFTTDLFEVTSNGEPIRVTADMITGKVDTFAPGVYEVTCELGGVSATAFVTVFDSKIMGTYKTQMTEIPVNSDDDDDDSSYDDWYADGGYYSLSSATARDAASVDQSASTARILKDMILSDNGAISVNGMPATLIGGVNENTLLMRFGNNNYTLYYNDGIAVLDPDNSIKLGFSDVKRPLVYFNSEVWDIIGAVTVNYGANYVLAGVTMAYSFDTFHIVNKDSGADKWYGLYVELSSKTSSDTIYDVRWGEVVYADGFVPQAGVSSSFTFGGETYKFKMESAQLAKVDKCDNSASKYAGRVFVGTLDGKSAILDVATNGNYSIKIDGSTKYSFGLVEKNNNKNWYEDRDADTLFIYRHDEDPFSFKLAINTQNSTFTVLERDKYYGRYEADGQFIYLDGYGTGLLKPNAKSYETFSFRYAVNGDVLTVTYVRTKPNFAYGKSAEFYIGEFLNTLKVKRFETDLFDGRLLENSIITDGAIVKIAKTRFGAATAGESVDRVKAEILKSITIVTKDGAVSEADKADRTKNGFVDVGAISATTAGYYRFSVSIMVSGEKVTSYYSLQIIKGDLENNAYVGTYKGVCFSGYDFAIDANAQVTINAVGTEYLGYAEADGAGLKFKAYSAAGGSINGVVSAIATDAVKLTVTGSVNFGDYYVKAGQGTSRVAAVSGTSLREISINNGEKVYVLAGSPTAMGEIVTLTSLSAGSVENGSTVKLEKADGAVTYIKIIKWGEIKEGLEVLNNYAE